MKRKRTNQVDVAKSFVNAQVDPEGYLVDIIPPKGRGVRTTKMREQGAFMLCYCGELISEEEGERREEQKDSAFRYFFNYKQKRFCIDATEEPKSGQKLGRLVNHGSKKERNSVMKVIEKNDRPYLCLFSSREIHPGEEILYDYGIKDLPWQKKSGEKKQPLPVKPSKNVRTSENLNTQENSKIELESFDRLKVHTIGDNLNVSTSGDNLNVATSGDTLSVSTSGDNLNVSTSGDNLNVSTSGDNLNVSTSGDNLNVSTSGDKLNVWTTDDKLNVRTTDDKLNVWTTDDKLNVRTTDDKLNVQTTDKILNVRTTDDNLNVRTTDDNLKVRTTDKILNVRTTDDNLNVQTTDDNQKVWIQQTTDDNLNVRTTDDSLKVRTTDENLNVQTTDDNMNVWTTDENLNVWTTGDNLKMQTTDQNLNVLTTDDNLSVRTTDDNLNVWTTDENLNVRTTDDNVNVRTTDDNLKVRTTDDNLNVRTTDDNLNVRTTDDNLNVRTTDDNLNVRTTDDNLKVRTTDENLNVRTADDKLNVRTTDDNPKVRTTDENLNVWTTDENLHVRTTDDNLNVRTTDDNLNVRTTDDNLKVRATDENLKLQTTDDNLNVQTIHDSLNVRTTDENLKVRTTDDNLNVSTTGDKLNVRTTDDNLNLRTTDENMKVWTTDDSLNVRTINDNLNVSTSDDKLNVRTTDSLNVSTFLENLNLPVSRSVPTSSNVNLQRSGDSLSMLASGYNLTDFASDDQSDLPAAYDHLNIPAIDSELCMSVPDYNMNIPTPKIHLNISSVGCLPHKPRFDSYTQQKLQLEGGKLRCKQRTEVVLQTFPKGDGDDDVSDSYISDSSGYLPPTSDEDSTDSESDRLSEVHAELQDLAVSTTTPIKQSQTNHFLAAANQVEAADQIATTYQAANQVEAADQIATTYQAANQVDAADQIATVIQTTSKDEAGWKPYFKNISVEVYNKKDGKRNYKKSDFCVYCKNEYESKISNHLFACHDDKEPVIEADSLPKGSVQRTKILSKLQNEGNYMHNIEVLKKGSGRLVVCRRPKKDVDASKYIPCEFCLAFVTESLMWQHVKSCICRPCELESEKNYVRNGRLMIRNFVARDESETDDMDLELDKLLSKMKETVANPGVKDICMNDKLIREFGISCLERLGLPEEQRTKDHDNIRTKMRSVGRLLQKLNEQKMNTQPLSFFLCPREFRNVVRGVKELSREANSPKLALNLGHYVKQISILKGSLALEEEDGRKRQEAVDFRDHYNAHWTSRVSSVANRTMKLRTMNKKVSIPRTEDLVLLRNFLLTEIGKCMKIQKPTYVEYVRLAWLLIVRIAMFTKRRISEVDELTVEDFGRRIFGEDTDGNSEIMESLDVTEKILYKRISLIEVRGKSTRTLRKVYILLTEDVLRAINHLLRTRIYAGVNPANKFIFGRSGGTKLDGCEAMREITASCVGLQRPELIRTRLLRKYLATTCQIMDMQQEELKMLADHMGHSLNIHTDVYRLQSSVLERTKVARVLLAVEAGQLNKYKLKGHCLDAVSIEELPEPEQEMEEMEEVEESDEEADQPPVVSTTEEEEVEHMLSTEDSEPTPSVPKPNISAGIKRKRWTVQEGADLMDAFKVQIQEKRNVGTEAIGLARKKYKTLHDRTEAQIRTKINNIILGKCKK